MSERPIEQRFAERMRAVRQARNWSAQEVANRSGMTRVAISKIENGDRGISIDEAFTLAAALDVTIEDMTRPGTFAAYSTIAIEVGE